MIHSRCCLLLLFVGTACAEQQATPPPANPSSASPTNAGLPTGAPSTSTPAAPVDAVPPPVSSAPPESEFPKAPSELQVPTNSSLLLKARGKGVQIYECASKPDDARAFGWKLKAPEADLFDDQGRKVAHHFAGPTWQAPDGSTALGSVKAKTDSPDPQAIPWLLLTVVAKGPGQFARVMHVQRLDTSGGKPPAMGCGAAEAKAKAETRVPYEATYYFYSLTPGSK